MILVRSGWVELHPESQIVPVLPTVDLCWLRVEKLLGLDLLIAAFVTNGIAVEVHSYGRDL